MIKLVAETIDKQDIKLLCDWLSQDEIPRLTKGDITIELEKEFAKYIGTKYSVFVNSGSSAILLGLLALKQLKDNNELSYKPKIVVPSLSWATDVSTPLILNYETILCDCNLTDLSVDLEQLEQIFINQNPDYFLLVSVLGLVPDMDKIIKLCKEYKVELIEDNCESLGSEYKGKKLGSIGLMSFFSSYYGHHISTIEGGFITTNNKELYNLLLSIRSHGWDRDLDETTRKKLRKEHNISEFDSLYSFYHLGLNLRSTDLQAFIGLNQIKKIDSFSKKRNENYKIYKENIKGNLLSLQDNSKDIFISNFAYPIVSLNKEKIVKKLKKCNVEVRPLIAGSMSNQPFWKKYNKDNFFKTHTCQLIHEYGFYVPNHQELCKEDIIYICDIINMYQ